MEEARGLYEVKAMNTRDGRQHTLTLQAESAELAEKVVKQLRFGLRVLYPVIDEVRLICEVRRG